jgi:hypothetical protein
VLLNHFKLLFLDKILDNMKKSILYILTSAAFIGFILVFFCGCTKQLDKPSIQHKPGIEWLYSGNYALIRQNLTAFINNATIARNGTLGERSGTQDMSIEDGLGLLESAIHFQFSAMRDSVVGHEFSTMDLNLTLSTTGDLSGSSIDMVFNNLVETIFQKVTSNKTLYLIDLEVKNSTLNTVQVTAHIILGLKGVTLPSCSPTSIDSWYVCCDSGKCNGTQVGTDATHRLAQLMNYGHCLPVCSGNTTVLWLLSTNRPYVYDHSPLGKLKWSKEVTGHQLRCFSPSEMSNNYSLLKDIVNVRRPAPVLGQNYEFAYISVEDEETLEQGDLFFIDYRGNIYYTIKLCLPVIDGH